MEVVEFQWQVKSESGPWVQIQLRGGHAYNSVYSSITETEVWVFLVLQPSWTTFRDGKQ